jgi:GntR family transcriptional regulator/MocR family aminotransferase
MYHFDDASPLHLQLYEALKRDITTRLTPGSRLPSIRKISQEYKISKNTVESAYGQLYAEGYIESRPKSGYYVADARHLPFETPPTPKLPEQPPAYRYDFFPARLAKESFPLKLWKRLFAKAVDGTLDFGAYSQGQGEPGLRCEIARYLGESRGVRCDAGQVVVTGAFMDAAAMIADLLQPLTKHFAIEHPGYHIARKVFERYGFAVSKIPLSPEGIDVAALTASKARAVYITPSHQYPTGVAMPVANRLKLLEWSKAADGFIIEDDYDSELTYRSRPIPSLQGLDTGDRVIYVGTFSKALSPALRVGYVVLPHRLLEAYRSFHIHFSRVCLSTQKTLELFMKEGHWERHLRRVRNLNRKKHDRMKQALLKHLGPSMEILSEGGGLAINIRPTLELDLQALRSRAEAAGLKLYFAKENTGGEWEAVRMGFGGLGDEEIEAAVEAFAKVWRG